MGITPTNVCQKSTPIATLRLSSRWPLTSARSSFTKTPKTRN